MKRLSLLIVAFLCLVPCAHADESTKRAKIEDLFKLMRTEQLMGQIMAATEGQANTLASQMFGGDVPADLKPRVEAFQKRTSTLIQAQLSWKSIEPEYVTMYSNNFTEEQIDGVLAFYRSPAGQAFVEKTPLLTTQGMQIAQTRLAAIQPQLKQIVDEFMKEIAAASSSTSAPKPRTK